MGKYIAACVFAVAVCFVTFAQSYTEDAARKVLAEENKDARKTQVIKPANTYPEQHPSASSVELEIDYIELTDEVRIYYTCMAVSFREGEAINTMRACLEDFQHEKGYFGYKYQGNPKPRYFKDNRGMTMATYSALVKYNR